MLSAKDTADFQSLRISITSTTALLRTFQETLGQHTTPQNSNRTSSSLRSQIPWDPQLDPLALLCDASKLLEAQTTKLSLLVLNEPFSPKEVTHILTNLSSECLPALASCVELLPAEQYTNCLTKYVGLYVARTWAVLSQLVGEIPTSREEVKKLHYDEDGEGRWRTKEEGKGRGTLMPTGMLWANCRKLIQLREGEAGQGERTVWHDAVKTNMQLVEDAITELEEWDPDDDDDESDDERSQKKEEGISTGQRKAVIKTPTTSEDEAGDATRAIDALQINPLVTVKARVVKHLKLIRMLCEALNKRRIATFPPLNSAFTSTSTTTDLQKPIRPSAQQIKHLDEIIEHTKFFTIETDEIAVALYGEDTDEVETRLRALRARAKECVDQSRKGWDGQDDVFTGWSEKWIARMEEIGR